MKKFISKYLIPAFMIYVLLMPHAERIAFQGGNHDGAQYTQIQFEGTFGLPVPAVHVVSESKMLSENRLELNSDYAVYSFTADSSAQNSRITLQSRIASVSLQSEESFRALPYDIYEVLNGYEMIALGDSVHSVSTTRIEAVPSYNQYGMTSNEIEGLLAEYNIPVTFSLDDIYASLENLSVSDLEILISKDILTDEGTPKWSLTTVSELEIEVSSAGSAISVAYPLFPGYSESQSANELTSAFCSNSSVNAGATSHHMIDFSQFENLSEVIIRSGNREQSTTCLEGYRSNLANSYTISGPGLNKNGFSEVLFVKS